MLLRLDAGLPRRGFAKMEETANLIAEFSHRFKIRLVLRTGHHIVIRYYRATIYIATPFARNFLDPSRFMRGL